jgi:mevalonate kinase
MFSQTSLAQGHTQARRTNRSTDRHALMAEHEHHGLSVPPIVLAPGRVFLIGEYASAQDGCAVVAAITRYAKVRFAPRAVVMSGLVSEVIKRARNDLSDVFSSLPLGSASIDVADFRDKGRLSGLGSSAAVGVATVGAMLETLGLPIDGRKALILSTASAGRRAALGPLGSGADSVAATYGGLVQISRPRGEAPEALPFEAPAELHLVLFSVAASVPPQQVLRGIQRYAAANPASFAARSLSLRECSQRFVEDIRVGHTAGALRAASRYTDELTSLAAATQVPIMNEFFTFASGLARQLGGVAKPTGAGVGNIGVAMFASREAADEFRASGGPHLTMLEGDLDRLGVRCQGSSAPLDEGPTEVDTLPAAPPKQVTLAVARDPRIGTIERAVNDVEVAPRDTAPARPPLPTAQARRRVRPALVIGVAAILGAGLAALLPIGQHSGVHPRATATLPTAPDATTASPGPASPVSAPTRALPTPTTAGNAAGEGVIPAPEEAHAAGSQRKVASLRATDHKGRRPGKSDERAATGERGVAPPSRTPAPRAGRLSWDEF